jgi:hypothetical protein
MEYINGLNSELVLPPRFGKNYVVDKIFYVKKTQVILIFELFKTKKKYLFSQAEKQSKQTFTARLRTFAVELK